MKLSDVMSAAGLSIYAEVALVIFMGVFLGVACHLLFARGRYEGLRFLPLEDMSERKEQEQQP